MRAEVEILQEELEQTEAKKDEALAVIIGIVAERDVLHMKVAQYDSVWFEATLRMWQLSGGLGRGRYLGGSLLQLDARQ